MEEITDDQPVQHKSTLMVPLSKEVADVYSLFKSFERQLKQKQQLRSWGPEAEWLM